MKPDGTGASLRPQEPAGNSPDSVMAYMSTLGYKEKSEEEEKGSKEKACTRRFDKNLPTPELLTNNRRGRHDNSLCEETYILLR